jgi:hypothetical protein
MRAMAQRKVAEFTVVVQVFSDGDVAIEVADSGGTPTQRRYVPQAGLSEAQARGLAAQLPARLMTEMGTLFRPTRGGPRAGRSAKPRVRHGLSRTALAEFARRARVLADAGVPVSEARERAAREVGIPDAYCRGARPQALRRLEAMNRTVPY